MGSGIRTFAIAVTMLLSAPLSASDDKSQWPLGFWRGFVETAVESGLEDAFGFERFPLLQTLISMGTRRDTQSKALEDWLFEQMRANFRAHERDRAYAYKGFHSCMTVGACAWLLGQDAQSNLGAEQFRPNLDVNWTGYGFSKGTINWRSGRFAGVGRIKVLEEYWDDRAGAYVMSLQRIFRPLELDAEPETYTTTLMFFSPCTFTGSDRQGSGRLIIGGQCPDRL